MKRFFIVLLAAAVLAAAAGALRADPPRKYPASHPYGSAYRARVVQPYDYSWQYRYPYYGYSPGVSMAPVIGWYPYGVSLYGNPYSNGWYYHTPSYPIYGYANPGVVGTSFPPAAVYGFGPYGYW